MLGLAVQEGTLKKGTPLCVERRGQKDPETGLQACKTPVSNRPRACGIWIG